MFCIEAFVAGVFLGYQFKKTGYVTSRLFLDGYRKESLHDCVIRAEISFLLHPKH